LLIALCIHCVRGFPGANAPLTQNTRPYCAPDIPAESGMSSREFNNLRVQISHVDSLFRHALPSIVISLLSILLCWFGLRDQLAPRLLAVWLGSLIAISVIRAVFIFAYLKINPEGREVLKWEIPYFMTLVALVGAWGLGGAWVASHADLNGRFLILFLLLCMAATAQGAYAAVRYILVTCVFTFLLPTALLMLASTEIAAVCFGMGAIIYSIAVLQHSDLLVDARRLQFQLADEKAQIERLAMYDFLTGLANRRAFEELSAATLKIARVRKQSCYLLMIDVDHFKVINDRFGHCIGDRVLKAIAQALDEGVRPTDLAARFGGEEFMVFLPNTERSAAIDAAERLRQKIQQLIIEEDGHPICVTVSIGLSGDLFDLNAMIKEADDALYESKRKGRNCVSCQPLVGARSYVFHQA